MACRQWKSYIITHTLKIVQFSLHADSCTYSHKCTGIVQNSHRHTKSYISAQRDRKSYLFAQRQKKSYLFAQKHRKWCLILERYRIYYLFALTRMRNRINSHTYRILLIRTKKSVYSHTTIGNRSVLHKGTGSRIYSYTYTRRRILIFTQTQIIIIRTETEKIIHIRTQTQKILRFRTETHDIVPILSRTEEIVPARMSLERECCCRERRLRCSSLRCCSRLAAFLTLAFNALDISVAWCLWS